MFPLAGALAAAKDAVRETNVLHPTTFQVPIFGFFVPALIVRTLGFTGQGLFTGRVVLQAWASRQKGESYTPASYWTFSLAAAILLAMYCFVISEPVGLSMQALMSGIYMRNIYMIYKERHGERFHRHYAKSLVALVVFMFAFFLSGALLHGNRANPNVHNPDFFLVPLFHFHFSNKPVLVWGFIGSAIFMSRFIVQWLASERARRSIVPTSFWVLASIGSLMLLAYFFVRWEPVQMIGQISTVPAYVYNLVLIRRKHLSSQSQPLAVENGSPAL